MNTLELCKSNKMYRSVFIVLVGIIVLTGMMLLSEVAILVSQNTQSVNVLFQGIFGILIILGTILLLIFYSIWLFSFHKELIGMDSTYPITPGGAMARLWIPIYNIWGIWNIHATYAERLIEQGEPKQKIGSDLKFLLPFLYALFFVSRGIERISTRNYINEDIENILNPVMSILFIITYILLLSIIRIMQNSLDEKETIHT